MLFTSIATIFLALCCLQLQPSDFVEMRWNRSNITIWNRDILWYKNTYYAVIRISSTNNVIWTEEHNMNGSFWKSICQETFVVRLTIKSVSQVTWLMEKQWVISKLYASMTDAQPDPWLWSKLLFYCYLQTGMRFFSKGVHFFCHSIVAICLVSTYLNLRPAHPSHGWQLFLQQKVVCLVVKTPLTDD
jgi:hypothetical protein